MNDGQDPYDPYAQDPYAEEPRIYGYDAYGRPVYQPQAPQQQAQPQAPQQGYDPYAQQAPQEGYGYDPYAQGQAPQTQVQPSYDPYTGQQQAPQQPGGPQQQGQGYGYDYAPYDTGHQPVVPAQREPDRGPYENPQNPQDPYGTAQEPRGRPEEPVAQPFPRARSASGSGPAAPPSRGEDGEYRTEEFAFVEDPDEESEDVIDWLKFAETRSERRDERRRKVRNRAVLLVVVLALVAAGGVGYLWQAGKLPGVSGSGGGSDTAGGPQQRDVIVVHLRETKGGGSSTALLVDNETTKKGTTVLLPNDLAVATEDGGSTTLGKSVVDEGSDATRDALGTLLGSSIQGTWRLDTPYLENLVELVGGITVDADTTVPGARKDDDPLVRRGAGRVLGGQSAVSYATYRAPGEAQDKQLARFGQVMQGALKKISSDASGATRTVESLAQITDPSLSEKQLGASLAQLAGQAKKGAYRTMALPVRSDGTLSDQATESVVKDVLGGTVKNAAKDAPPRVSVENATGTDDRAGTAKVTLVNGGFTVVSSTQSDGAAQPASRVTYTEAGMAAQAKEVAKSLGLTATAVKKGKAAANADITVVLGQDYDPKV